MFRVTITGEVLRARHGEPRKKAKAWVGQERDSGRGHVSWDSGKLASTTKQGFPPPHQSVSHPPFLSTPQVKKNHRECFFFLDSRGGPRGSEAVASPINKLTRLLSGRPPSVLSSVCPQLALGFLPYTLTTIPYSWDTGYLGRL